MATVTITTLIGAFSGGPPVSKGALIGGASASGFNWQAVTAVAACVGAIAIVFFYRQSRETARARTLESTLAILDLLDDDCVRKVRELVFKSGFRESVKTHFESVKSASPAELNTYLRDHLDLTWAEVHSYLASLEHISMLVLHDSAPDEIVEMYFGRLLPHQWDLLSPLIDKHRTYYGNLDFLQHLEACALLLGNGNSWRLLPRRWSPVKRWRFAKERRACIEMLRVRHREAQKTRESQLQMVSSAERAALTATTTGTN